MEVIKQDQVQEKIIIIRNQKVIVDSDVAELYGVETKRINEAVKIIQKNFPKAIYLTSIGKRKTNWSKISTGSKNLNIHQRH